MLIKKLYHKFPIYFLLGHLLFGLAYCLYLSWKTNTLGGDTLEHIHSSWLVYANFIPYKDFFQHHNPLLWYVFSPIVGLHAHGVDDNIITSIVTSMATITAFINYAFLYLITSRFLSNKEGGVIAAAIAFTPYMLISIIHFRPDNFMMTCFFAGLYFYFSHIKEQKMWQLSLAMMLFWLSFMFLQKIIFTLIILALITIFLLYKKVIKVENVIYSMMLPVVLSAGFVAYLWANGILAIWYHSNFTFNLYIPELFSEERRYGIIWPELKLLLIGSFCAIIFLVRQKNIFFNIITILFLCEFAQRLFYFSAFAYYFYLLIYLASILSATFMEEKLFKRYYVSIYVLLIALGICMYKPSVYEGNVGDKVSRFYEPLNKKVVRVSTPCDYILNGDGAIYNLYNRDPYYYWNLLGQLDVIGDKIGIHPMMDINEVIEKYKPKIIYGGEYKDKYFSERGIIKNVHTPSKELLDKYYKRFDNSDVLYILKPEYSHIKCDFDYKQRYYHAYE